MIVRSFVVLMTGLLAANLFAAEVEKAERLVFRTTGNDCYADGTPVGAGECYAFVWQEDGYDFPGFPMNPPNPDDPFAMGDHIWVYDYYPKAERSGSGGDVWAKCSEVIIAANSQVVWETQHGKWFVYLLDTRHKLADGTVVCGYNKAETNAPVRINAYKPVTGLTDIVRELTYSPVGGKDLTGGASVADLPTDAITYQISFDARGGTVEPTSLTLCYGDAYGVLPVPTRAGCEFLGWYTSSDGIVPVTPGMIASSNATVYALWSCTATFDANGGEASEETRDLLAGDEVGELPTADRTGYTLAGWFTAREGGEKISADTKVMRNVMYYAQWSANAYDVNFNGRGGDGKMISQKMTYDVEAMLSNNLFRCVGYTFRGWTDDEAEFDEVLYEDGVVVSNLTDEADGTVDLYAVWQANAYTVKFNANGGKGEMKPLHFLYDEMKPLSANVYARTGYGFDGWATRADGEVVYAGGATVSNLTAEAGGVVELFAVWTPNAYDVDFDGRGGDGEMPSQPMTYDEEEALYSNLFHRVGYTFLGWTDDEAELEEVLYEDGVVVSNLTDEADGTVDLYAVWQANAYIVKFNANGGEGEMTPQSFVYDQAQALIANGFRREGYAFEHWTNAAAQVFADRVVVSNLMAEADGEVELFAVWQAGDNVVTFDACGGEVSTKTRSVKTQHPVGELPTAERAHFTFDGWFTEDGERVTADTIVTASVTYYAQWSRAGWDGTVANDWLELSCAQDVVELALNEEVVTDADHYFSADSGSAATLKVSGLPTGVKFDAKKRTMSGKAKKKGVFYVTVTATNKSKYTQTRVMVVKVDGAEPDEKDEIGLNCTALSNLVVGTALSSGVVTIPSGASASGLPKGLKVVKKGAVDAAGAICDSIEGIPTKGGKYTVKVTAKNPTRTTLVNVIVADPGSKYIAVVAEDGGTATKSGVYAAGSTLKLTAKAKSKMAFVGWKRNDETEFIKPQGADYRATSLSTVVGAATPTRFTACFVSAAQDAESDLAVVPDEGDWTFDAQEGPSEFRFRIDSDSLPKVSIKPIPAGFAFNGVKDVEVGEDGEQRYRLVVKDAKKTKPGVYNLAFNVGNASVKQKVVTNLTLVVKNKRSGLYDGDLEYELPYEVSVGVGDASKYPAFAAPAGAKVSVSGLPSGLKYKDGVITGVATKAGEFTVTITTTINKVKVVDTVFMSVDALPAQLVGTFNGAVTNDDVMATEKLTLTATDKGKVTAKVGTLSISKTGWDRFVDGKAYMTLLKSSGKGAKAVTNTISVCVDTSCAWNTLQISGDYKIDAAGETGLSGTSAQRNPFGKSGKTYVCAEAHELALALAARTKQKINLYVTNDVESAVWVIGDAAAMKAKYPDMALPAKAPLTVQVKDTGAVTLAGKLDKAHSASGSTVLTVNEESVTADFVVGKGEKKVVASLVFEMDETGTLSVSGAAWTYVAE